MAVTSPDRIEPAPRFSIVVPTYNRATSLADTVESCFGQRFTDFELIVIDDGSTDDTLDVLARIEDERLVVATQPNAGPAAARNHGMRLARGAYIAFLDSDDRWSDRFLACCDALLQGTPEAVVYGQIVVDRGVGRYWIKPDRALAADESIFDFLYVHGAFVQTSTLVVPEALARTVGWDERLTYGDNDQFAIDCWKSGTPFRMLPEPLVLYDDRTSADALSQLAITDPTSPKYTNFFAWMDGQRGAMSESAWIGFNARFRSAPLMRSRPLDALGSLWRAWRAGAIGATGVARQIVQNLAPRQYRRLTDLYVSRRGLPPSDVGPW